jgi:hypothetical protein
MSDSDESGSEAQPPSGSGEEGGEDEEDEDEDEDDVPLAAGDGEGAAAAPPPLVETTAEAAAPQPPDGALGACWRSLEAFHGQLELGRSHRVAEVVAECLEAARALRSALEQPPQPPSGEAVAAMVRCAEWLSRCSELSLLAMTVEYKKEEALRRRAESELAGLEEACSSLLSAAEWERLKRRRTAAAA